MKRYFTLDQWVQLLRGAAGEGNALISIVALSRLSGLKGHTLRRALFRIEEKGLLERQGPGVYLNRMGKTTLEELAMSLRRPCYISFESALSRHGVVSQIPLALTCATTRKPGRKTTVLGEITFRHLTPSRFWGFREENRVLWAEPEKALLDWLYWFSKTQGRFPDMDELDVSDLDRRRLKEFAARFPRNIKEQACRLAHVPPQA